MNEGEALDVLARALRAYREMEYDALVRRIGETDSTERSGTSGAKYQVDVQVFWDDQPQGDVRVMGSVDDGGWRAFRPLTRSFIKSPANEFVDE